MMNMHLYEYTFRSSQPMCLHIFKLFPPTETKKIAKRTHNAMGIISKLLHTNRVGVSEIPSPQTRTVMHRLKQPHQSHSAILPKQANNNAPQPITQHTAY